MATTEAALDWYRELPAGQPRRAFWASFLGYGLDAFDFQSLSFALAALIATFGLSASEGGLLATVTLVTSAIGGVLGGVLADRIGRVRALLVTVGVFSVFSLAAAFAPNYGLLLTLRGIQGLGFGGEWGAGAALIAEFASPRHRGRLLGVVQSAWALGWGAIALTYTVVFSLVDEEIGWRILFGLGVLPALVCLALRSGVEEPRIYREQRAAEPAGALTPLLALFRPPLLGRTLAASLLAIGAQGGYYALFTWLPTYLKNEHGLKIFAVGSYLAVVIAGAFVGYLVAAYLHDALGHRRTFAIFAICAALTVVGYTQASSGGGSALLLVLGFPLGFFPSGMFSGFGSYLAELYPTASRGAGLGFTYNVGRGLGALFPFFIGVLSEPLGLGAAITLGAAAYGLSLLALLVLPETRGTEFA